MERESLARRPMRPVLQSKWRSTMSQDGGTKVDAPQERFEPIYIRHVVRGEPIEIIAKEMSLSTREVLNEIERVERALIDEYDASISRILARHTARLEAIYLSAVDGYEQSCEDEIVHKRSAQGDQEREHAGGAHGRGIVGNSKVRVETTTRRKSGNARFLWEARSALSDIRRMWGGAAALLASDKIQGIAKTELNDRLLAEATEEELRTINVGGAAAQRLVKRLTAEAAPDDPMAELSAAGDLLDAPEN
jgi:hypothetical protein